MTAERPPADILLDIGELRLRFKRASDAVDDYAWRKDPELARLDGGGVLTLSFADYLAWFEAVELCPRPDRTSYSLETAGGTHVGNVMVYNVDPVEAVGEIGISIAVPAFRNRGLGAAVMVALTRHIWQTTPLRGLRLHVFDWNARAIRAFEHAGYTPSARVVRGDSTLLRMESRREWWLLWDQEGQFERPGSPAGSVKAPAS